MAGVAAVALMLYMTKRDDRAFLEHMKNDEVKKASQPAEIKIFDDEKMNDLTKEIQDKGIITEEDVGISKEDQNALDDKYEEVAEEPKIEEPSFAEEAAKFMPKKKTRKKKGRKINVGRPKGAKNKKVKKVVEETPAAEAEAEETAAEETV